MGEKQIVGMEDIILKNDHRKSTIVCYSADAEYYFMDGNSFLSLLTVFELHETAK